MNQNQKTKVIELLIETMKSILLDPNATPEKLLIAVNIAKVLFNNTKMCDYSPDLD